MDSTLREQTRAALEEHIPSDSLQTLFDEGATMTFDEAVALALESVD